jgi:hypothetical protein
VRAVGRAEETKQRLSLRDDNSTVDVNAGGQMDATPRSAERIELREVNEGPFRWQFQLEAGSRFCWQRKLWQA